MLAIRVLVVMQETPKLWPYYIPSSCQPEKKIKFGALGSFCAHNVINLENRVMIGDTFVIPYVPMQKPYFAMKCAHTLCG